MALPVPHHLGSPISLPSAVGPIQEAAYTGILAICGDKGCEVVELNVRRNNIHQIAMIPSKRGVAKACLLWGLAVSPYGG